MSWASERRKKREQAEEGLIEMRLTEDGRIVLPWNPPNCYAFKHLYTRLRGKTLSDLPMPSYGKYNQTCPPTEDMELVEVNKAAFVTGGRRSRPRFSLSRMQFSTKSNAAYKEREEVFVDETGETIYGLLSHGYKSNWVNDFCDNRIIIQQPYIKQGA